MRVLHLLDRSAMARPALLAMLADALGRLGDIEQRTAALGRMHDARTLAALGITVEDGVPAWRGLSALGIGPLRRMVKRRGIDLLHTWSPRALSLAAVACPDVPRLLTVSEPTGARGVRWLRVLLEQAAERGAAGTGLLAISNTRRRELLAGGIDEAAAVVLRPGLDLSRVNVHRRDALRKDWGVKTQAQTQAQTQAETGSDARVVVLAADPPAAGQVRAAMDVLAASDGQTLAAKSGPLVLVVPPLRLGRRVQRHMRGVAVHVDPAAARPWDVLPGADAALMLGEGGGGLALLWAMAANVPIVAEATYAISEIVEDRHSALLARPGDAAELAQKLEQLRGDRQLAWRLRDTARHEAYSFFSRQRYCENLANVYRQMRDSRPLDVPPPQVTGGLRFTGRA
jgi:glycosyltransferase involved in cell wall biosynthesis